MSFQGIEFTPEMRKMVVNVKQFFDSVKRDANVLKMPAAQLASSAPGISGPTVKVITAAFNKNGEQGLSFSKSRQRGRHPYTAEPGIEPLVRRFVRRADRDGDQVNTEIIRNFMREELHCTVARTTLRRALQRWGFEFGKGIRSAQLKESERMVLMRRQYLRLKRFNRGDKGQTDRPEVYPDESYINKNHSDDNT